MTQVFRVHAENPQARLIAQVVARLRKGEVVVYPTDTTYGIGCALDNKKGLERIERLRRLDDKHQFSILVRDLSDLAVYAKVENWAFRLLKANTPGPYTFILPATSEVPRRLMHPKRKTLGLRVPDNAICQAILEQLGEPIMNTTLQLPGEELPLIDPEEIEERLGNQVDMIVDGGWGELEPSTVVEMVTDTPQILRVGKGDTLPFE